MATDKEEQADELPPLSSTDSRIHELTTRQQEVYDRLNKRSQTFAEMYGGIHLCLSMGDNPDRFAQSAHSARELMEKLEKDDPTFAATLRTGAINDELKGFGARWEKLKAQSPLWKDGKWQGEIDDSMRLAISELEQLTAKWSKPSTRGQRINKMVNRLSPAMGALPEAATVDFYQQWKDENGYFQAIAHHNKPVASESDHMTHLVTFDSLLITILNPQPLDDLNELDALIAEGEAQHD
jgi:hypothetical protein